MEKECDEQQGRVSGCPRDAERSAGELKREREGWYIMTVSRDRWGVRGDNVVCGVTEILELFRDDATELVNQLVTGIGDVAKCTDLHRGESG